MKIRIIDSNDNRAAKLVKLLAKFNSLDNPRSKYTLSNEEKHHELLLNPDCFFLHISDQTEVVEVDKQIRNVPSNKFLEFVAENFSNSLVILYSGGSLTTEKQQGTLKIQSDTHLKWKIDTEDISRFFVVPCPISTGEELLELDVIAALEKYSKNRDVAIFSQTLQPASDLKYLEALSWLCQGYLAVTAPEMLKQNKLQPVIASLPSSRLSEKRTTVSSPEWWRTPFVSLTLSELKLKSKQEWNSGEDWFQVEQLLNEIEATQEISLETVRSAYEVISRRLR